MFPNPFRRWSEEDIEAALERSIERLGQAGARARGSARPLGLAGTAPAASSATSMVAAREPAHAFELRPLLDVALDLRGAFEPAESSDAARAQLMALIRDTPQEPAPRSVAAGDAPVRGWGFLGVAGGLQRGFATAALATVVAAIVLLAGFGRPPTLAAAATLTVVSGEVQRVGGASPGSIPDGAAVFEGDSLRLGPDALAILTFADGSTVQLSDGAELTVARARFEAAPSILVEQRAGQIIADLPAGADRGSSLKVEAPGAVIEAHIGGFAADVGADGTRVQAFEHSVAVNAESPRPEVLVPGESRLIERVTPTATPLGSAAPALVPSDATAGPDGRSKERGASPANSPAASPATPRKPEDRRTAPGTEATESPVAKPAKPAR